MRTSESRYVEIEITRKLDYIFHRLCFSVEELFKYSSFMLYGLDSHLKPRYLMHQWIKSKRIIRRNFKLDYIMSMSEKQFRSKFVGCHADGLRVYNEVMRKVCEEMLRKTWWASIDSDVFGMKCPKADDWPHGLYPMKKLWEMYGEMKWHRILLIEVELLVMFFS